MAKAMLIMDMPRACCVCPFCYKAELMAKGDYLYKQLYRCRQQPQDIEDVYLNDVINEKQTWCPLREVPQKKEVLKREQYEFGSIGLAFTEGYNRCIDEILGGGE